MREEMLRLRGRLESFEPSNPVVVATEDAVVISGQFPVKNLPHQLVRVDRLTSLISATMDMIEIEDSGISTSTNRATAAIKT